MDADGQPSLTALTAAAARAAHLITARDVGQRDMIPAPAWERSDSLRPAELSRIAHAAIG